MFTLALLGDLYLLLPFPWSLLCDHVTLFTDPLALPGSHLHLVCCRNEGLGLHIWALEVLVRNPAACQCSRRASCWLAAAPQAWVASWGRPQSASVGAPAARCCPQSAAQPGHSSVDANLHLPVVLSAHNGLQDCETCKRQKETEQLDQDMDLE